MSLTPELRKHFGAPEDRGVLVAHVDPGTPAAAAGVRVGDVIVQVRDRTIDGAADVLSALADAGTGDHAKIVLVRDGTSRTLDATLTGDPIATGASPAWLRDWMKPFDAHHAFAFPFDDAWWLRDWMKPIDPPKHQPSPELSSWFETLRDLFQPKSSAAVCQRS